jgi:hypothetical protein
MAPADVIVARGVEDDVAAGIATDIELEEPIERELLDLLLPAG